MGFIGFNVGATDRTLLLLLSLVSILWFMSSSVLWKFILLFRMNQSSSHGARGSARFRPANRMPAIAHACCYVLRRFIPPFPSSSLALRAGGGRTWTYGGGTGEQ
jgi:hypothetical protein